MENTNSGAILITTWLVNILAYLDRGTITFIMGFVCTTLAIVYYIIKIRQELKK